MSEEDKVLECQAKAKKMLAIIQQQLFSCEEVKSQAKQAKYYTKVMDEEIRGQENELGKIMKIMKAISLGQKLKSSDMMKHSLVEAANMVKTASMVIKDIKHIAAKGKDNASVLSKAKK
jgi:hypothetical protein